MDKNNNNLHNSCRRGYQASPESTNTNGGILDTYSDRLCFKRGMTVDFRALGKLTATSCSAVYFMLQPEPD